MAGSEILFYENCRFEKFVKRVAMKNVESFEVSPGPNPHVVFFMPPVKGQPAVISLKKLCMETEMLVVCTKTSFNCDKCTLMWNSKGTAVLATATVEVDKSDKSYYGVSHLYILTTKGETIQVPLDKTGQPLHDVKWSPSGNQFVVCYGFMPSKVAVYNVRGDTVWQHGEAHRNEVYYNPFGTILAICSFGNISSGKIEFWNVETKQKINTFEVPSTTAFEWAPDGNHFITATTAPRLRIANGRCHMMSKGEKEELWQVCWKPSKAYSKTEIVTLTSAQQEAIANNVIVSNNRHPVDSLKQGAIKKEAYVPPHMRKPEANKPAYVSTKPPLSEHEKKLKSLEKKLEDISKLKEKKASGVTLELNQEEKIKNEHTLLEEIQQLRVSLAS
uniref:Eukaryotic translation initiation factor 2A n=1 Tax=Ditylenchus dipsaci TaxID=166011 RepID=A0A915DV56_9BILA